MVKQGALIVQLDEEDEQRRVDQAKTELKRAEIAYERAKFALEEREKSGLPLAEARLKQAEARFERWDEELKRLDRVADSAKSDTEYRNARISRDEAAAAVEASRAEVEQANIALKLSQLDIDNAQQAVQNAEKAVDEANQRLRETKVISPITGMVLKRYIEVGEVVQSPMQSFTGGTILMDIADVDQIYAMVNVDEADIGLVRELAPPSARPGPPTSLPSDVFDRDEEVKISVESFPEEEFFGVIESISPQTEVVGAIATFRVAIRLTSENRYKLIGLLNTHAEAAFTAQSVKDQVLVPFDAIFKNPNGDGHGVYVRKHDPVNQRHEPEFRLCQLGVDNGLKVEVKSGLDAGVEVYTDLPVRTRKQREEDDKDDD